MEKRIQSRKNHQTGTIIDVIRRMDEKNVDGEWADVKIYETICVDHGTVCEHETLALAKSFAAAPLEWCEDCLVEHDMEKGYYQNA